ERLVPFRGPLVPVVESLQELRGPRVVGHLVAPPDGGGDVVGGGLELLARLALRTARAVRDQLVAQARLRVLAVHGDVIGQVGIDQDDVRVHGLQTIQHGLEVLAVQIERLVHHDLPRGAAPRMGSGPWFTKSSTARSSVAPSLLSSTSVSFTGTCTPPISTPPCWLARSAPSS